MTLVQHFSQHFLRNIQHAIHMTRKVVMVREASFNGDLGVRQFIFVQQASDAFDPPPDHILMRRHACRCAEQNLEVRDAENRGGRKVAKRNVFREVAFDVIKHLSQPAICGNKSGRAATAITSVVAN